MKIFDFYERNRIKSQCDGEILEYIELLEKIAEKATTFWANDYITDQHKKKKLDDDLYDILSRVEFMNDSYDEMDEIMSEYEESDDEDDIEEE